MQEITPTQPLTPEHIFVSGFNDLLKDKGFVAFVRRMKLIKDTNEKLMDQSLSAETIARLTYEKETLRSMNMKYVANQY